MTISLFSPVLNPKITERIEQTIAHLDVPCEALLLQAYADIQRQIEECRCHVQQGIEQTQADGLAALARILLDADTVRAQPSDNYLTRS